jgi:hypothetical protein
LTGTPKNNQQKIPIKIPIWASIYVKNHQQIQVYYGIPLNADIAAGRKVAWHWHFSSILAHLAMKQRRSNDCREKVSLF